MKNTTGDALFELAQLENDQIDIAKGAPPDCQRRPMSI